MRLLKTAAIGLFVISGSVAAGDCAGPDVPTIPDGASSSMEQMMAAQKGVKAFQTANIEYMACVEVNLSAAGASLKQSTGGDKATAQATFDELEATYNAAVSAEEEVAGQFNAAIRDYKDANPG